MGIHGRLARVSRCFFSTLFLLLFVLFVLFVLLKFKLCGRSACPTRLL